MGPQVVDVVEVDVRKQRRDHRPLRGSFLTLDPYTFFEHAHLQPFLDQADNPPVADAVFNEADQPVLAQPSSAWTVTDRIEEPRDIGVENPAHFPCLDPERERVQRIVLATSSWWSHASHGRRNP